MFAFSAEQPSSASEGPQMMTSQGDSGHCPAQRFPVKHYPLPYQHPPPSSCFLTAGKQRTESHFLPRGGVKTQGGVLIKGGRGNRQLWKPHSGGLPLFGPGHKRGAGVVRLEIQHPQEAALWRARANSPFACFFAYQCVCCPSG